MTVRTRRISTGLYVTSEGFRLQNFKDVEGFNVWRLIDAKGRRVGDFPTKRDARQVCENIYKIGLAKSQREAVESLAAKLTQARIESTCQEHQLPREDNFKGLCIQCVRDRNNVKATERYVKELQAERAKLDAEAAELDDDDDDDDEYEYDDDDT